MAPHPHLKTGWKQSKTDTDTEPLQHSMAAQMVKNLNYSRVQSTGQEDPLEKGMATHSSHGSGERMDRGACQDPRLPKNQAQPATLNPSAEPSSHLCLLQQRNPALRFHGRSQGFFKNSHLPAQFYLFQKVQLGAFRCFVCCGFFFFFWPHHIAYRILVP